MAAEGMALLKKHQISKLLADRHYFFQRAITGWDIALSLVGRVFLPAHRSEQALQHPPDAHGPRTDVESHGLPIQLIQRALRLDRAVALAQIVEPCRAMVALDSSAMSRAIDQP